MLLNTTYGQFIVKNAFVESKYPLIPKCLLTNGILTPERPSIEILIKKHFL